MFMYYIILYIYGHPQPGPTLSFLFVVFAAEKTFILLTSFCVFYTATQVRYSLTRVFLQFLNCHLVTPHPKTPRLPSLQSKVAFVDELG